MARRILPRVRAFGSVGAMDCAIVHVPKMLEWSPVLGWAARVTFVSMGVLSIAEELVRCGHETRIVHVGVEKYLDRNWSLVEYLRASGATVVAFALHWHPQTYDTLALATRVKEALPEIRIVLGGLTASYFADQILEQFPAIDAVIRGEGERPLAELVTAWTRGEEPAAVPNLTWRSAAGIIQNDRTFVTTGSDMDAWSFSSFDLMEHADTYLRLSWRLPWEPEWAQRALDNEKTIFGLALGRGCLGTCTWCAGSYGTTKLQTGRKKTAWRQAERVAATIRSARENGVERFYSCFDPHPRKIDELLALFEILGTLTPKVALDFEAFGLPSNEVLASFAENLHPSSRMILSPESSDEALRKAHRAFPFSNAELEACLAEMDRLGIPGFLYFIIGLPGETREDILATARFQQGLKEQYTSVEKVFTWPLEMEPNSPWFNDPERFGITLRHRTLMDFYEAHRAPDFSLGYDSTTLSEAELLSLRDTHFLGIDPTASRKLRAFWAANRRDYSAVRTHRG